MALTVSLLDLRTWAKQRAHMENGGPLDDTEWNDLINAGVRKLHRALTQAFGPQYFKTSATLTTTASVKTVAVPGDFYKLVSLWWDDGSGTMKRIRRATEEDIERELIGQGWGLWLGRTVDDVGIMFAIRAASLEFIPTPLAAHTLKLNYIPAPARLNADIDTLDGYGGYEEFVAWDATAAALAKEEGDPSFAMHERDMILADVVANAERDQSEPGRIQDTVGWMGE